MIRPRKILCIFALALGCAGAVAPGVAVGESGGDIDHAGLKQAGRSLIFSIRTSSPVALKRLRRLPDFSKPESRYLCMALRRPGSHHEKRLCLGGVKKNRHRIGLTRLDGTGAVIGTVTLAAKVKRPGARKLVVTMLPGEAGFTPRRYRWRAIEGVGCTDPGHCVDRFPAGHDGAFRLRPVRAVGCTGGRRGLVRNGPRRRRVVALTFDDGPSTYTPGFLRVLRHKHVNGTFFELGQETSGKARQMRRILAEGNEIGNHSTHHSAYPGVCRSGGDQRPDQAAHPFPAVPVPAAHSVPSTPGSSPPPRGPG